MPDDEKSETAIMHEIMLTAPTVGVRLFRNNVGVLQDKHGSYVRFGVANPGGADLIGWTIRREFAVFTAVEVKKEGKHPTKSQQAFLDAVTRSGGFACVATCVEDFLIAFAGWRK